MSKPQTLHPWPHDKPLRGANYGPNTFGIGFKVEPALFLVRAGEGQSREQFVHDLNAMLIRHNSVAGIPDPAAYIKAMREVYSEAEYVLADLADNADNRNRGRYTLIETARIKKLAWAIQALRTLSTPESEVKRG